MDAALTADTSGIADADGLENSTFGYRWSADGSGIPGATGSTYTPTDDDVGKTIRVRVSFSDDAGNGEALLSAPTATVAARPNSPATGVPTISGTVQVGETLTASASGIADTDGLTGVSYSYQWMQKRRQFGHGHPGRDGRHIHRHAGRRRKNHQGTRDLHR